MIKIIIDDIITFFRRLYLRYLLVTELYMVEGWEKLVIHVVLLLLFMLMWYINLRVVMTGVWKIRNLSPNLERIW